MKSIKDREMVIDVDIDDTLIIYEPSPSQDKEKDVLLIDDPYGKFPVPCYRHEKHIRILKRMHGQGYFINVRSAGGAAWAEAVIKALDLEKYVDFISAKPVKYIDDLPVEAWYGSRIYFKPE